MTTISDLTPNFMGTVVGATVWLWSSDDAEGSLDYLWTLSIVAALLRQAGSGPVFPLALADASGE